MRLQACIPVLLVAGLVGLPAQATVCDYRLSELAGRVGTALTSGGGGSASGGGVAIARGGFQIVIQPSGGGSAGGSGPLGLVRGAASAFGVASSVAASPSTMLAVGSALVGAVGLQVGCHFRDERISDYDETLQILRRVAADMPEDVFQLVEPESTRQIAFIRVLMRHGEPLQEFEVRRLSIVNGRLVHRDWGPNTVIGDIAIFLSAEEEGD